MSQPTAIRVGTRERILAAASQLFSRQGYSATGLKSVLSVADAPFGSLYHFFPGGKEQLGVAVLEIGGDTYRDLVESIFRSDVDIVAATRDFFEGAAAVVEATGFADACPIATIALEVANTSEPMRRAAAIAFESWLSVLTVRFEAAGLDVGVAGDLSVQMFCAIEGAFLLSRATRSVEPILIAGRAVTAAVEAALLTD